MSSTAEEVGSKLREWWDHPDQMVRELFGVVPDPWQDEVLKAFPHQPLIAMKACKGPGKGQPVDSRLYTPDGERRWGDLAVGDEIFAGDGSVTIVAGVYDRGVLPTYRVTFNDGSYLDTCGEHLWAVKGRTERRLFRDYSILSTEEIIERGVREKNGRWAGRQFEIPQQGAAQFSNKDLSLDPYVMGAWLGDGHGGNITSACNELDAEIVRRGYEIGPKDAAGHTATIYGIATELRKYSVYGLKSYEKFVPEEYRTGSIQQRLDVLRGLMDTDGCIGKDGHCEFAVTSWRLANDVIFIARSLGGIAKFKPTVKKGWYPLPDGSRKKCRDCYRVTVTLPVCPFTVSKKANRWKPKNSKSQTRYLTRYIDSIEPIEPQHIVCIKVDHPSSLYLANDFIVTHNTCLLAWLAWNFLLTRPYPKIAATSITADNLSDNLWAEMSKWQNKSDLLKQQFKWTKTRIEYKAEPNNWFMSARTWPKSADADQQADTLAGLHADYILFILDESGGIPQSVMVTAEAGLSSPIEGHILQAGNPTHLEGPLYRACTVDRKRWWVAEITGDPENPMRSPRVSVEWAQSQIDTYGRDNPWVLINVMGQFPPSSINTLIGPDEVRAAMARHYTTKDYGFAAKVLGVDVAREGDDSSVIFPRQGIVSFKPKSFRNIDSTTGAGAVNFSWNKWNADACFIDATGGWATGWIDQLRLLGKAPIGVGFSAKADDEQYYNKRAEIYFRAAAWVKDGGALPNIPGLVNEACAATYTFKGDRMLLEDKAQIKARLGKSPDFWDAFCLTFAQPVHPRVMLVDQYGEDITKAKTDYDPFGPDRF